MNLKILFCSSLLCSAALAASQATSETASDPTIPHLQKRGTATQLIVDGKPYLALAGELLNSSATGVEHMKPIWPKIVETHFNTVLAGVSWAQIEPAEGIFDFSVQDGIIKDARSHNLRLVLLWFGSWKNGLSSYPPDWLKKDFERFPRAQATAGRSIEQLSSFSDANRDADARAFAALMRHVKQVDGSRHTVIMIQVENEINGLDHSPAASQALAGPVPKELMDYLQSHKDTLTSEVRQVWEAAGSKTSGTWEQVFGKSGGADEIFIAWHYASYTGKVAEAGKAEYPIPMFCNTWGEGFPRGNARANGAPKPSVIDIWRAGAPKIDMLSPDIYSGDFTGMCADYTRSGNPLFIPETGYGANNPAKAIYAFGHHDAIGFSPFGIDREDRLGSSPDLAGIYDLLSQLAPLILEHQGDGTMAAVMLTSNAPTQKVQLGGYTLQTTYWPIRYTMPLQMPSEPPPGPRPPAAVLIIASGPDEFFALGSGVKITFAPNTPGPPFAGLATVEEGAFVKGRWVPTIRLAGDDTGQGEDLFEIQRHIGIQRFTLYRYK